VAVGDSKSQIPNPKSQEEAAEDFCREIEAYLCRKNDGHLIRIVGPSFEMVCGWATRAVPLKVAFRGIDRHFARYYAKGPRRRPVRIDFCEADVLDVFDEWRRAVGVALADPPTAQEGEESRRRRESLPAHLDRIVARLTSLGGGSDRSLDDIVDDIVRELDAARASAKNLRGAARTEFLARLASLDERLVHAARARLDEAARDELRAEAEAELAPFRARMPREAYAQSLEACTNRLIRDRARLPVLTFD
jgi:hypothetical protein